MHSLLCLHRGTYELSRSPVRNRCPLHGRRLIKLEREGEGYVLAIKGQGGGLHQDADPAASATLGMTIIRSLAAQLGGEVDWSKCYRHDNAVAFPRLVVAASQVHFRARVEATLLEAGARALLAQGVISQVAIVFEGALHCPWPGSRAACFLFPQIFALQVRARPHCFMVS